MMFNSTEKFETPNQPLVIDDKFCPFYIDDRILIKIKTI